MTEEIYIKQDGPELGPYTGEDVLARLDAGELSPEDRYWHDGLTEWMPLADFDPGAAAASANRRRKPRGSSKVNFVVGSVLGVVALVVTSFIFMKEAAEVRSFQDPPMAEDPVMEQDPVTEQKPDGIAPNRKEEFMATMRAAGRPTSLAELDAWFKPVADSENAALLFEEDLASLPRYNFRTKRSAYVRENADRIPRILEFSRSKKCRFPTDYRKGGDALLPHLNQIRAAVELLSGEAERQAKLRRPERSVELLIGALRIPNSIRDEPTTVAATTMTSRRTTAWKSLREVLNRLALTDPLLTQLQTALSESEASTSPVRALVGQKLMIANFFLLTAAQEEALYRKIRNANPTISTLPPVDYRTRPEYRTDFDVLMNYSDELIAAGGQDFPELLDSAARIHGQLAALSAHGRMFSGGDRGNNGFIPAQAAWESRRRIALVVIAVERFRIANQNRLPADLQELVPTFLGTVPTDPFDGSPLRYHRPTRGYVVYSIGGDRKDDLGVEGKSDRDPGDIAFAVTRR